MSMSRDQIFRCCPWKERFCYNIMGNMGLVSLFERIHFFMGDISLVSYARRELNWAILPFFYSSDFRKPEN